MFEYSGPVKAVKTLAAIDEALERDQGRTFRRLLRSLMPLAEDAYNDKEGPNFRSHLGASLVGKDCTRELWYTFRWAYEPHHKGRLIRLFNRGHLEEPRFIALLQMIGCEVWHHDEQGKQLRVSFHHGHFGGSLDSILRGVPDVDPTVPVLGEFKTHKDDSFVKLEREGVRGAKFEHYVQMQTYMGGFSLPFALYLAVNKDTDDLYGEIVKFDPESFKRYCERAWVVITAEEPPPKVNPSPGWWKCKTCDYKMICHFDAQPGQNCRTCVNSVTGDEGQWFCRLDGYAKHPIPKEVQLKGCSHYRWIAM